MTDAQMEEIRRHFDVVAEGIRGEIRQVADGVLAVDERLSSLHRELVEELGEVKAMMKFSFVELDRRVTSLERLASSLSSRVEKLESAVS